MQLLSNQFRITAVSINQTPLDFRGNTERILRALREVGALKPNLVFFPELCISGYGCEDSFYSRSVTQSALKYLDKICVESKSILPHALIEVGLPLRFRDTIYNCAAFIQNGKVVGIVPKQNLAGDGIHYEQRWFTAWRGKPVYLAEDPECITESMSNNVLLGPLVFDLSGIRIACEICEDAWVPNRPADHYTSASPDVIICPSASHFAFAKQSIRRNIALDSSRSYACVYASVNLLGNEAGRSIYDGSTIIAAAGELIQESNRFSFADHKATTVDVDLQPIQTARGRLYSFKEQEHDPLFQIIKVEGATSNPGARIPGNIAAEMSKHDEFAQSVSLGLYDYLRKSRSRGFVVSLSGGADSAACAILAERAISYSSHELGRDKALKRLGLTEKNKTSDILHTIYQATKQSSNITKEAAAKVASSLGTNHHEVDVESIVKAYSGKLEEITGRPLSWETDDLTLQNIQARARSPMAWILTNATGSLLLATSNRSEASVGYCTMDGDTSGGIAPIAGVDKHYLRQWLIHMEKVGDIIGKIPELSYINSQAPTAELKPGQTDESDLMPYELLNQIEALAIRDKKSPVEVYQALIGSNEKETLKKHIARFFKLWSQNQWKRERFAPSFHLDDRNVDPRSWCRFPILNSGYDEEIQELMRA